MTGINEGEVTGLITKLNGLTGLTEVQQDLLKAIIKVVASIQERDEGVAFSLEFDEAFTKEKADLVLEYVGLTPTVASASAIIKFADENAIIRAPQVSPPAILRTPPTAAGDNDEQA
jgi:hypothetical protein